MLTGKLLRVRHQRHQVVPLYVSLQDPLVRALAEQLLEIFRRSVGRRRGELAEELADLIPEGPQGLLPAGLAHLLEERCTFQSATEVSPEPLRAAVFTLAAQRRRQWAAEGKPFDRQAVLAEVLPSYGQFENTGQLDEALFADLKSEQRIVAFEDLSAERLLERYNVALAQGVLLRAVRLEIHLSGATPARFRQLCRAIKFHRLIVRISSTGPENYRLEVDGPLSLFSATHKYGLQLALFLPTLLHCTSFHLQAHLRWSRAGKTTRDKTFTLSSADGLRSHLPDWGMYTPPELEAFVQAFRSRVHEWSLQSEPAPQIVGDSVWVPDYRLVHQPSGREVYLEFFGFWRKADLHRHCVRLQQALPGRFLLCVGEGLRVDEATQELWDAAVYRYKRVPLAEEVAERAAQVAGLA
jgi:predicted nuclease of restriction endonuclease-like RecB superfamily